VPLYGYRGWSRPRGIAVSKPVSPDLLASGILPFVIDAGACRKAAIRGRMVRLDGVVDSILDRHQYPPAIAELAAEAMVLASCLSSTMDFDGIFTLQAKGDGAIKTLLADVTSAGAVRGYAAFDDEKGKALEAAPLGCPAPMMDLMGVGHLAFTVDQGKKGRYQGIVPIEAREIKDVALRYFRDSEQIDTALFLAANMEDNNWQASGLLLQRIPATGGTHDEVLPMSDEEADIWHTACALMATLGRDELLANDIEPDILVHRLFHELGVSMLPWRVLRDECRCSPDRVEQVLASLSPEERLEFADDNHQLTISCEFCKTEWSWYASDTAQG
jgi:molecular chaperone Hsp33